MNVNLLFGSLYIRGGGYFAMYFNRELFYYNKRILTNIPCPMVELFNKPVWLNITHVHVHLIQYMERAKLWKI